MRSYLCWAALAALALLVLAPSAQACKRKGRRATQTSSTVLGGSAVAVSGAGGGSRSYAYSRSSYYSSSSTSYSRAAYTAPVYFADPLATPRKYKSYNNKRYG